MNDSNHKRLIILFRDGDLRAMEKIRKDYSGVLQKLLKQVYGMKKNLLITKTEKVFECARANLKQINVQEINVKIEKELKKACHEIGMQHAKEVYFPDIKLKVRVWAKEIRGKGYDDDKKEVNVLFQHLMKQWETKIKKILKANEKDTKSKISLKSLSIIHYFNKKAKLKIKWLINHPEKEKLKKMRNINDPVWEEVRSNFYTKTKYFFSDLTCDEAVDALKQKFLDLNFRLYCIIDTWLFATARNLEKKEKARLRRFNKMITQLANTDDVDTISEWSPREENKRRIGKLMFLLIYYNLMLRITKGEEKDKKELNRLIDLKCAGKSWNEILIDSEQTNGAARTANCTYKKKLREELLKWSEDLRIDVLYRYTNEEGYLYLGIVVYDYSPSALKLFLNTLHNFVYGQISFVGRVNNKEVSSFSKAAIQYPWKISIANDSGLDKLPEAQFDEQISLYKSLSEAIQSAKEDAKTKPFSIVLMDGTIHGKAWNINLNEAKNDLDMLTRILFDYDA